MSCLESLLGSVGRELEGRLAQQMRGFAGAFVRVYLPQCWVFVTEQGVASLTVDRDGRVAATSGAAPAADVTIETSHDRLKAALSTRDRSRVPPGPLTVTPHTAKGRAAFDLLRGRVGL